MAFPLLETNPLIQKSSCVWFIDGYEISDKTDDDIPYETLRQMITGLQDVTSNSIELEKRLIDGNWISEYYFSPRRTNIFRSLNLKGIRHALEIECGCGTITRYLGELNICVDAVEASPKKAEIARLRCRDLEHVEIVNALFCNLELPQDTYDAVFLMGTVEYAKKYLKPTIDDKDAVVEMLSKATASLKKNGLLFIAGDNRMGLKYWLGASDNHYRRPYTGLYGYLQDKGIRSFDKKEWDDFLQKTMIRKHRFIYPFPDYQFSKVVLSDTYIQNDSHAHSVLFRVMAKDYFNPWQPDANEFLIWRALHQAGYLEQFANSFFIIGSDSAVRLNEVFENDFVVFPDLDRKPRYRTLTKKPSNQKHIVKRSLADDKGDNFSDADIRQDLSKQKYIRGDLLSTLWLKSVVECDSTSEFEALIKKYYNFILQFYQKRHDPDNTIDILPFNIIVDDTGSYTTIDSEWLFAESISPEYVLFRTLLWFPKISGLLLKRLCELKDIGNIFEFIEYGFSILSLPLMKNLNNFIDTEERFQTEIYFQKGINNIKRMIEEPFQFWSLAKQTHMNSAQLFWSGDEQRYDENKSVYAFTPLGKGPQKLLFIFYNPDNNLKRLRLKPMNRPGFFNLFHATLKWMDIKNDEEQILFRLNDADQIAKSANMEDVLFQKNIYGNIFLSTGNEPYMDFELPAIDGLDLRKGPLFFDVMIEWPAAIEYLSAGKTLARMKALQERNRTDYLNKIRELKQKISRQQKQIEQQSKQIESNKINRYLARIQMVELKRRNQKLSRSFETIKQTLPWNVFKKLKKTINLLFRHTVRKIMTFRMGRTYEIIKHSCLFDISYYLHQNPDVDLSCKDPIIHFIKRGVVDGLNPGPLFDTAYYLSKNPDVSASGMNPLEHYIVIGAKEGKNPNPLFDTAYYLSSNQDVLESETNPLEHYLTIGAREGRDPNPLFSSAYYLSKNTDVSNAGMNPLVHFIDTGSDEGRDPGPLFDTAFYVSRNPDVLATELSPLEHYLTIGADEGRDPNPLFSGSYYLSKNPEIRESGQNPLAHFLKYGADEKKNPCPLFDTAFYVSKNPDVLATGMNPLVHYIRVGADEGRDPNPLFSGSYYLSKNPDVLATGMNPLVHYIRVGADEGLDPNSLFSSAYYFFKNPDVRESGQNPLAHFLEAGADEMRNPCAIFDVLYYVTRNPDVLKSETNPLEHYLTVGVKEGKNPNPLFHTGYYLSENPDVTASGMNPLAHYLEYGAREGKNPNPLFHTVYYLEQNPDITASGVNPLAHYLEYGAGEGRDPNPIFSSLYYLKSNPDVIKMGMNPLAHYIEIGAIERRDPGPLFDTAYYLEQNPDIAASEVNPLQHYLLMGAKEGKDPNPFIKSFPFRPLITVIFYLHDIKEMALDKHIRSVLTQIYDHFELVLIDDGNKHEGIQSILFKYEKKDQRVRVVVFDERQGHAISANKGISISAGEFLLFLNGSDLKDNTLYEYVDLLNQNPEADLIFSDQNSSDISGYRIVDYVRPDLLLTMDYFVGRSILFRRSIVNAIGGLNKEHEGPYDYQFLLKFISQTKPERILRISK